jgi:transcriptional regulator with XRE-family HTH domain
VGDDEVSKSATELEQAFGRRLKACRKARGYKKQTHIAKRLEIDSKRYWKWESGNATPQNLHELEKLCDLLGVTSDYLLLGRTHGLSQEAHDLFIRGAGNGAIENAN